MSHLMDKTSAKAIDMNKNVLLPFTNVHDSNMVFIDIMFFIFVFMYFHFCISVPNSVFVYTKIQLVDKN